MLMYTLVTSSLKNFLIVFSFWTFLVDTYFW